MKITLKNFGTSLPKELLQLAEKNKVRECDEPEKGHFIAYVDEGKESYDVSITIAKSGEITNNVCDCKNGNTFCRHKAALLVHVANGKKIKPATTVKAKKKVSAVEALLEEISFLELKEWAKEILGKNKDLELSFINRFSTATQIFTPDDVLKIINNSIKVVVGNKKNIEVSQLKKVVDLWDEVLKPVITQYQANVMDEAAFMNFHTMLDGFMFFYYKINLNSNKIPKLIEDILAKSEECINILYDEDTWKKAVGFFMNNVFVNKNNYRLVYLIHLENLCANSSVERRTQIIKWLVDQYKDKSQSEIVNSGIYTNLIFDLVNKYGLLTEYVQVFKPVRYDNVFNEKLINALIENDILELAATYARQQMAGNYRPEFNLPYLMALKNIYKLQNDEDGLVNVLNDLMPFTYDFEDYKFIYNRLPLDERRPWRTRLLSRASNAASSRNKAASAFRFHLLNYEQSYKKMIDYVDAQATYSIIFPYAEDMIGADKNKFLDAIIKKGDDYSLSEEELESLESLYEIVAKYYNEELIRLMIAQQENRGYYYRSGKFMQYAKAKLGIKK